jgi:putative flippase GtrA
MKHFAFFIIAGGAAALVNIGSRIVLNVAMPYEIAIVGAYLCGMTVAYALNKAFVFAPSGRTVRSEYLRFAAVNAVAIMQVWVISVGLARWFFPLIGWNWHAETVAHIIGVGSPVISSYFGHRYFSFARSDRREIE